VTSSDELPESVQALLRQHLESYEHLQLLLLLSREPDGVWTVEDLSTRLNIPTPLVTAALASLQACWLVEARTLANGLRYVYAPKDPALEPTVRRLAREYDERTIQIIKLMSANAIERLRSAALRAFADAFILRKDNNDG
jgi:hypothetical protein